MKNNIFIISSFISIGILSAPALAKTQQFSATVNVQNTFNMTKGKDLSFGTIRAKADTTNADIASLVIPSDPDAQATTDTTGTGAVIAILGEEGSAAEFSIEGLPQYASLTITNPTETDLVAGGSQDSDAKFKLSDFTYFVRVGTSAGAVTGNTLRADAEGKIEFLLGATLNTSNNSTDGTTTDYVDGEYSGTFNLEVDY
ncbi:hypothetical protein PSECIP111951_03512 [Pseudoalteromonas holothuriae]|uniref:DUF4402 domain-containing protein n=1 Tax=Pseudoalteromonas holothuriae TaxID=2963714 RepID=A0A9W4R4G2_9GAMM|nr:MULTISPECIES: DUF4402 domain-containing protein [unclassified Pseudoalteromonas]CAH9066011.1 hypothetical protein PSECIP111854_03798 [Pseudoalteromonas sp. CIP111854]CAH9066150.1 hypothetical protein PSECIP111951_03512 [Pseudoalteromonas sp. CIP111951]